MANAAVAWPRLAVVGEIAGRHGRGVQDAVAMDVLGRVVGGKAAVLATRRDHRDLALEGDEGFQDQRHAAHRRAGAGEPPAPCRGTRAGPCRHSPGAASSARRCRRRSSSAAASSSSLSTGQEAAVEMPMPLRNAFRPAGPATTSSARAAERRARRRPGVGGSDRHVLELVGHDGAAVGQLGECRRRRHRRRRSAGWRPAPPGSRPAAPAPGCGSRAAPRPSPACGRAGRRR